MLVFFGFFVTFICSVFFLVIIARLIFDRNSANEILTKHQNTTEHKSLFIKKYAESNPQRYRSVFLNAGLILAISFVIVAFEWTTSAQAVTDFGESTIFEDFTEITPPPVKEIKPPPPPNIIIEIKKDDIIIEDEPKFETEEIKEDTKIDAPDFFAEEEKLNEPEIYLPGQLEVWPEFPGGEKALIEFLSGTPYPREASWMELEGIVHVSFVINEKGEVTNVEAVKGPHKILNDAAVERVKKMPAWSPGKQKDRAVKVRYHVPIRFAFR